MRKPAQDSGSNVTASLPGADRTSKSASSSYYELKKLAPHLPSGLMRIALESVCSIRDANHRSTALVALIPHLPRELLDVALNAILALPDDDPNWLPGPLEKKHPRTRALAACPARLPPRSVPLMRHHRLPLTAKVMA